MKDFEKELQRIIEERKNEIEKETDDLLNLGKEEYFKKLSEKTKNDFLASNKSKIKGKANTKSSKFSPMKKILLLIALILICSFVYYKFLRKNNDVKKIEYSISTIPIKDLISDPRDYEDKEVSVSGTVTSSFNLGLKYYIINDETGSIYVITDKAVPKEGEIVKVTGIFNQRFKIADKQVETIRER